MNNPLVSVLVPVCNVEQYLPVCLESIIKQTLSNIEILCLNDGSTDRSEEILWIFAKKDSRIQVINKSNTGYGHTMNLGLDMAKGKYIGIVESDDFADLEMFEKLYRFAELHEAEVVKGDYYTFTEQEESIHSKYAEHIYGRVFVPRDKENHSVFFVHWAVWCGIYRRDFLMRNKIRFNETPGASYQDTAFMFKIWACATRAYIIREPLLHYRRGNPKSSSYAISKVFCFCDEYEEIERFLDAHLEWKKKLIVSAVTRKHRDYLMSFFMLASAYQYAFLLRMERELKRDMDLGYLQSNDFTSEQWNAIQMILKNREIFFKKYAKDFKDTRLEMCSTLNKRMYEESFRMYLRKFERTIIFGAGILGEKIGEWISQGTGKKAFCFAVTSLENNPSELLGVPVREVKLLKEYAQNALLVLAIKERDQFEALEMVKRLGFQNIILLDMVLRRVIEN